jgi:hypothetical protein
MKSDVDYVARRKAAPPSWALLQRSLIAEMNDAAVRYQDRYTRADGSFVWREFWPGIDGSDDGYESYHNWPLFYALGGSDELHERSRFLWEAVTRQFRDYGQIYREFDAHYDWMHHGESSIYFYFFGLADPTVARDRARTERFAGFYTGDDGEAQNWNPVHKMIRSPLTGSRGPRFENQWDDWSTHRWVLANYPAPFEDIPGVTGEVADWTDDRVYAEILNLLNERQMRCDVPLNLTATSLVTHAFLYTGEEKYRRWVLDYTEAWADRIKANGGICPDNIGPSGTIGETMGGKWWGGYYGWRWPHGYNTIIQPLLISAMNAQLLTGDSSYLDVPRSQMDRIMDLGREEDGVFVIPNRYTDDGWKDYRPVKPEYLVQLWYASRSDRDRRRIEELPQFSSDWDTVVPGRGKGDDIHIAPWYRSIRGFNDDYPQAILAAQWEEVARRMAVMAHDDGDPESWDVHHWQEINPVHTEALVQLTCGGPQIIYHGGLLHVALRWFDAGSGRPGLPSDCSAMVNRIDGDELRVTIYNQSVSTEATLVGQGGAFGEHRFSSVAAPGESDEGPTIARDAHTFSLRLLPSSSVTLDITLDRYRNTPSYRVPV